jgi:hypothetical protein
MRNRHADALTLIWPLFRAIRHGSAMPRAFRRSPGEDLELIEITVALAATTALRRDKILHDDSAAFRHDPEAFR